MSRERSAAAPYLDLLPPETVARVSKLEVLARSRMQGAIVGRHASPDKGASTDFAEHRDYRAGDDPRRLDWRAYARRDRYLVREYLEETNLRATLLLDASGSMNYAGELSVPVGGGGEHSSKFEYARSLAAVIANFLINQGDASGLIAFDEQLRLNLKASTKRTQFHRMLSELHGMEPGGDTGLSEVLGQVVQQVPSRGLVILLSDLFDQPAALIEKLHFLKMKGHEVIVFHVLADEELTFPFQEAARFRDLETLTETMQIDPGTVRARYLEKFGAFLDEISAGCRRIGVEYLPLNTREAFDEPLATLLARR